jgi:nicotinamidase-related amidase
VHVVRLYKPDGSNVDLCRRADLEKGQRWLLPGTPGAELAPGLLPANHRLECESLLAGNIQRVSEHEAIIYKPRWGAFYQTPLEAHLRGLGVTTLIFAGCNFPNCPRASVVEASERDFRAVLVRDGVSGLDDRAVREMENIGVAVLAADALQAQLRVTPASAEPAWVDGVAKGRKPLLCRSPIDVG